LYIQVTFAGPFSHIQISFTGLLSNVPVFFDVSFVFDIIGEPQLPPVAQQELLLLVRVALKKMAQTPPGVPDGDSYGDVAGGGGVYVADYHDVLAMPAHVELVVSLDPQVCISYCMCVL